MSVVISSATLSCYFTNMGTGGAVKMVKRVLYFWTVLSLVHLVNNMVEGQTIGNNCSPSDIACQIGLVSSAVVSLEQKFLEQSGRVAVLERTLATLQQQPESYPQTLNNILQPVPQSQPVQSQIVGHPQILASSNPSQDDNLQNNINANIPQDQSGSSNGNSNNQHGTSSTFGQHPNLLDPNQFINEADWPRDCRQLYLKGERRDGVYSLYIHTTNTKYRAYCNMTGGGWTLIFRHGINYSPVSFNRSFAEFKRGFGSVEEGESFWLGNELVHRLTYATSYKMQVFVKHHPTLWCEDEHNATKTADYTYFLIEPEVYGYKLQVGGYSGTMGNVMNCQSQQGGRLTQQQNQMQFSTFDRDADAWWGNCAKANHAGFWYNDCGAAMFTKAEPDYLDCSQNRWHYELAHVSMAIFPN